MVVASWRLWCRPLERVWRSSSVNDRQTSLLYRTLSFITLLPFHLSRTRALVLFFFHYYFTPLVPKTNCLSRSRELLFRPSPAVPTGSFYFPRPQLNTAGENLCVGAGEGKLLTQFMITFLQCAQTNMFYDIN